MELDKIRKLLEKYDEGETSVREERLLSEYFRNNEVPRELAPYRMMFTFTDRERLQQYTGEPVDDVENEEKGKGRIVWSSIAAVIVIALGLFYFTGSNNQLEQNELGTITEEEMAMEKTKEALNTISFYLNSGTNELSVLQEFNDTTNKIVK